MRICDRCKKELPDAVPYKIRIEHDGLDVEYDCCSKECCSAILSILSNRWGEEGNNKGENGENSGDDRTKKSNPFVSMIPDIFRGKRSKRI